MSDPIIVSANAANRDTLIAGVRYLLLSGSAIATFAGYNHLAGQLSLLVGSAGTIAGGVIFILGLLKTHKRGSQVASMAANPEVPASVATLK